MLQNIINNLRYKKRFIVIITLSVIVLLCLSLNVTFSAFTKSVNKTAVNIRVGTLNYHTLIGANETFIIEANANNIAKTNVTLVSDNTITTKYGVIYEVCTDSECNNIITKPNDLIVEYSSYTTDSIMGNINANGTKYLRIVVTNNTSTKYYIKLGVSAGFTNNQLIDEEDILPKKYIADEYIEDDLYLDVYINGNKSNTFPDSASYIPRVECNNNVKGYVTWDSVNSKWIWNKIETSNIETKCRVYFTAGTQNLKDAIIANNSSIIINDASTLTRKPGKFLVKTDDDYTTNASTKSYIFRGNIDNNYVIFANKCWKIVRITGNGAIKLILHNNNGTDCSTKASLAKTQFNNAPGVKDTASGIGFMYGEPNPSGANDNEKYLAAQANTYDSTLLTFLKAWYDSVFTASDKSKIADVIWCNDKSLDSGTGYGNTVSYFNPRIRINDSSNIASSLICPNAGSDNKLSKFTSSDTTYGNGALNGYKIGLLTVDEVAFAGGKISTVNHNYYLYRNQGFLLISPVMFSTSRSIARIYCIDYGGDIVGCDTSHNSYIYPSIALESTTTYYLDNTSNNAPLPGTVNNPYIID